MAARRQRQSGPAKAALIAAIEGHLRTAMGVRLTLLSKLVGTGAGALALAWLLLSGAAAALVVWWSNEGRIPGDGHARLASLIAWSVVQFPILVGVTRLATVRVLDIVRRDILPFASDDYAAAVAAALARQGAPGRFRLVSYAVALFVLAASLWSIRREIGPVWWGAPRFPLDLLFWSGMSFYYALMQMEAVVTATFPRDFAAALEQDRKSLFPPRAVDSPLVQGLATLNRTLLVYWAIVFVAWATVMLLMVPPAPFALTRHAPYLFIFVPLVTFCSIGLGASVYLRSESAIRTALRRFSLESAAGLQRKISALLRRSETGDEQAAARFERLTRLHDQMIAGGRYGSRFGATVSVALPFAMPLIGLLEKLFG